MKAVACASMVLGCIVLFFGGLMLNPVLALIGCIGLLAGFAVNKQMTYDKRLMRIESQLRIILQTQRQPNAPELQWPDLAPESDPTEAEAYNFLKDA